MLPKRYRDFTLALLLLVGCGPLLLILLSEWLYFSHRQADLKARLAETVEVHLKAPSVEQARYELPALENYAATVERPLFMENRRPAEVDASEPEPVAVEKLPLNLKLMGVASTPERAVGLFVDARGKYKRLHKNETWEGWKVSELEPGKAIMEQDGVHEELKVFKLKPKKKSEPPVPGTNPNGQMPGQPVPGIPQPVPGSADFQPQPPMDADQPNPIEPIDEIAVPPEDSANDQ